MIKCKNSHAAAVFLLLILSKTTGFYSYSECVNLRTTRCRNDVSALFGSKKLDTTVITKKVGRNGNRKEWFAPVRVSKATQERIKKETTPTGTLARLLETPSSRCNPVNIAATATQIARLLGSPASLGRPADFADMFASLASVIEDSSFGILERFSGRQLANVSWALAKIAAKFKSSSVASDVEDSPNVKIQDISKRLLLQMVPLLDERIETLNGAEITMTLWAYASLFPRAHPASWRSGRLKKLQVEGGKDIVFRNFGLEGGGKTPGIYEESADDTGISSMFESAIAKLAPKDHNLKNLAKISYALANRNHPITNASVGLLQEISYRTDLRNLTSVPHPWDLGMIAWSLSNLQQKDRRLSATAFTTIETISKLVTSGKIPGKNLSKVDLNMITAALSHSRVDDINLLTVLFGEIMNRIDEFEVWEVVNLSWAIAHLYLKDDNDDGSKQCAIFDDFVDKAVEICLSQFNELRDDDQACANIVWALAVLDKDDDKSSNLILEVFKHCSSASQIDAEHAHQLWQAYFVLESRCAGLRDAVSRTFVKSLESAWEEEKARLKRSSQSHLELSKVLTAMRVAHKNEHDEDIDVAIVLDNKSGWSRIDSAEEDGRTVGGGKKSTYVAVEYDGPEHFSYNGVKALGHTHLKYRVLKKKGWTVVRVPYHVWERIPHWASMERQRYLQRLLKTDKSIRFSAVDYSEYTPPKGSAGLNRVSRFD